MRRRWILIFLYFTIRALVRIDSVKRRREKWKSKRNFSRFLHRKKKFKNIHTAYCANTHTHAHTHTHTHTHTNMSRMSPALRVPEDDSIVRNIVTAIEQEVDLEADATTSKAKSFSKKTSAKRGPLTRLENHLVDANEKELPATR